MTQENKIKNAARYWFDCQKEGFPKGQKEVFEEWLNKDIRHYITYEELFDNNPKETHIQTISKEKKKIYSFPLYFLGFLIFIIIFFVFIKLLY